MASAPLHGSCGIHRVSLLSVLVLLLLTCVQVHVGKLMKNYEEKERKQVLLGEALAGSRPPNCERRCKRCTGHCEAVQVPATTVHDEQIGICRSTVNERSNYKPLKWKCKCGNMIFNP